MNDFEVLRLFTKNSEAISKEDLNVRNEQLEIPFNLNNELKRMLRLHLIERNNGKWQLTNLGIKRSNNLQIINFAQKDEKKERYINNKQEEKQTNWADFRKLLGYYIDCIRFDERPSSILNYEQLNSEFRFISPNIGWVPELNEILVKNINIPFTEEQSPFIRRVMRTSDNEGVFLGYPIHIIKTKKGDSLIQPIACIPVEFKRIASEFANLDLHFEDLDINSDWLDKGLYKEDKGNFLKACKIIAINEEEKITNIDIYDIVNGINSFLGDKIIGENINLNKIQIFANPNKIEKTSICNCAILYVGKKIKYSINLIRELKKLKEVVSDSELNKSSLKYLFNNVIMRGGNTNIYSIPFFPANNEQEEAANNALNNPLTVITGPPGTGKSQVIANILTNLAIKQKTALFTSKNHKAIDAVVNRTNSLSKEFDIIYRCNNPETGISFDWQKAIKQILAMPPTQSSSESFAEDQENISKLLHEKNIIITASNDWTIKSNQLAELQSYWDKHTKYLSKRIIEILTKKNEIYNINTFNYIKNQSFIKNPKGILLFKLFWLLLKKKKTNQAIITLNKDLEKFNLQLTIIDDYLDLNQNKEKIETLSLYYELANIYKKILQIESEIKDHPTLSELNKDFKECSENLINKANPLLKNAINLRFSNLGCNDKDKLLTMKNILSNATSDLFNPTTKLEWEKYFTNEIHNLIKFFPMWAVTSLSTKKALPFAAGIVDMVIIDEASQCEIPTVIPALFRAKTAVVVGDPMQFSPIITLSKTRNQALMNKHRITDISLQKYNYIDNNIFNIASIVESKNVQLKDHFRCNLDVATFFNNTFYNKTLRVCTDHNSLKVPLNYKAGLIWKDICTTISGPYCKEELDEVVKFVADLNTSNFEGTIGVITPFKKQAERINDAIFSQINKRFLIKTSFISATAHRFQGDERDVIILSLCYQEGLPKGHKWLLADHENRNLMNVATSRAKALLYIIGNKELCKNSQIQHLTKLATADQRRKEDNRIGEFDSIWEEKLYTALKTAGIETISQYPIAGKRLDLAIPNKKIDIEVDGEKWHKDVYGKRKAEDLWRDHTLDILGWTVIRFWVYELRENMEECINTIKNIISNK